MFDAAIIGAGPAGCSAAIHLARCGQRVALIEARIFPRLKVCGEFISPAATALLEELIAPDALRGAGAQRVNELVLELGEREVRWRFPREQGAAWVLSRGALDALLVRAAADAGAAVFQPAPVVSAEFSADDATLTLADGRSVRAKVVIHADGHGRFDAPPARVMPVRKGVLGHKCRLGLPVREAFTGLRMRSARGGYIGMVGVENGLTTIALVARREVIARHKGDADAMLRELWPAYDSAWRASEWVSCGIARSGFVRSGHERSFRVGNAAGAVEPAGGEGIGLALWSGRTLATLLVEKSCLADVHRRYAAAYRAKLRWRRPACAGAAWMLERPVFLGVAWPALRIPAMRNLVIGPWYRLSGKTHLHEPGIRDRGGVSGALRADIV